MKFPGKALVAHGYLVTVALLPGIALLWQYDDLLFGIKGNWLVYPIFFGSLVISLFFNKQLPKDFFWFVGVVFFYFLLLLVTHGDLETLLRIAATLMPFFFLPIFYRLEITFMKRWFWVLYSLSFMIPLVNAYLQYSGKLPYYEFDVIDGVTIGRISGGYNKPMNFIAFLFPFLMLALYWIVSNKRKLLGHMLAAAVGVVLYLIGHRTSSIAFVVIYCSLFFREVTIKFIYNYYKYGLNFIVGIGSFFLFYLAQHFFGLTGSLLRGRIAMWEAHAESFFNDHIGVILFGSHEVLLGNKYKNVDLVDSLREAHNNTYRTIIVFGIFGFLFYCLFVRKVVLYVYRNTSDRSDLFVKFSCFSFLILYCITNEPAYYTSILWAILLWILPLTGESKPSLQRIDSQVEV